MRRVDEIEDAILGTLRADAALASYVRTFLAVPSLREDVLEKLALAFPAVGVLAERGTYDYSMNGIQDEMGLFLVLCLNRNLRSPMAALRGGTAAEKGVWDTLEDCRRAVLALPSLGLEGVDCLARERRLLFAGENFAAAVLEVEARWRHRQ